MYLFLRQTAPVSLVALSATVFWGCGGGPSKAANQAHPEICVAAQGTSAPEFLQSVGCRTDFDLLASEPLDTSLPGARSVKVLLDQADGNALYFQNSQKYPIHHQFAFGHLSGQGRPFVPSLSEFNRTEYYSPDRRFILGAVTYYAAAATFALEIAPYDTASSEMIEKLYWAIEKQSYFGPTLVFHPTSEAVEKEAKRLSKRILVRTTGELFAGATYQPLHLNTALGRLRFARAENLNTEYLGFRDIVVLDRVPNDIAVVSGLITEEFQTPLSHVNVLAQTRGTPNMGLSGAMSNPTLRALEGKWVKLTVGASDWSIAEVSQGEADAFWEKRKPAPVKPPPLDTSVTDLRNIHDLVTEGELPLRDAIKKAIQAFGAKASHYSILAKTEGVPVKKAFAIPVHYYVQFMTQNGFYQRVDELLNDPTFQSDPAYRDAELKKLRAAMQVAPVDPNFQKLLKDKLAADYPGLPMRFRSSTNAEDLDGFPCAGCYDSKTGKPEDWEDVLTAIRKVWAGVWFYRTFEERSYHSMDHKAVAMALLVHNNFADEEANGVAVTANPFDPAGLEPAFYINVQYGGAAEVVHPPPGITSDQLLCYFNQPGQPITYLAHSNLIPAGETVLTPGQVLSLSTALDIIHQRFSPAYGPAAGNQGFYALEVDFKFDGEGGEDPVLFIKQARPHPGRGK